MGTVIYIQSHSSIYIYIYSHAPCRHRFKLCEKSFTEIYKKVHRDTHMRTSRESEKESVSKNEGQSECGCCRFVLICLERTLLGACVSLSVSVCPRLFVCVFLLTTFFQLNYSQSQRFLFKQKGAGKT